MKKEPVLVSACLLGLPCRYDGQGKTYEGVGELMRECVLIPVCPEQLGGLPTPRPPAERQGDRVVTETGTDVTEPYGRGAKGALRLAELYGCRLALLKEKSPSCGCGRVYDGTFSRTLTEGNGLTAETLLRQGVEVFGESRLRELTERIRERKKERSEG